MYLFLCLKKVASLFCPGEARETSLIFLWTFQGVATLLLAAGIARRINRVLDRPPNLYSPFPYNFLVHHNF